MGIRRAGYALLTGSAIFFTTTMYAIVFSKILPSTSPILKAIAEDRHYCLLVVLTIPATVIFAFLNWLGLKFFRHN